MTIIPISNVIKRKVPQGNKISSQIKLYRYDFTIFEYIKFALIKYLCTSK